MKIMEINTQEMENIIISLIEKKDEGDGKTNILDISFLKEIMDYKKESKGNKKNNVLLEFCRKFRKKIKIFDQIILE